MNELHKTDTIKIISFLENQKQLAGDDDDDDDGNLEITAQEMDNALDINTKNEFENFEKIENILKSKFCQEEQEEEEESLNSDDDDDVDAEITKYFNDHSMDLYDARNWKMMEYMENGKKQYRYMATKTSDQLQQSTKHLFSKWKVKTRMWDYCNKEQMKEYNKRIEQAKLDYKKKHGDDEQCPISILRAVKQPKWDQRCATSIVGDEGVLNYIYYHVTIKIYTYIS